jgi:hypothetical protein
MLFNFNYGLRNTNYIATNVVCGKGEVKPQLVVGSKNFVVGRFLATVGGWGKNKMVKLDARW